MALRYRNIAIYLSCCLVAILIFMQPIVVWRMQKSLRELKWDMKIQILQQTPSSVQEVFYFTEEEWQAMPHPDPHEFVLKGEYYDVFYKKWEKGRWEVRCVHDMKEGEVKADLKKWMADDEAPYQQKKSKANVFSMTKKIFFVPSFSCASLYEEGVMNGNDSSVSAVSSAYSRECFQPPCS